MTQHLNHNNFSPVSPPVKRSEPRSTFVASSWRDINGVGSIRGACDLYTRSGLIFRGVLLHQREDTDGRRQRWIQIPGQRQADGTFTPVVEFSTKDCARSFNVAALNAIDELLRPGGAA